MGNQKKNNKQSSNNRNNICEKKGKIKNFTTHIYGKSDW